MDDSFDADAFQKRCEEADAKRANAGKPKGGATADNQRSEKEEKEQRTQAGMLIKLANRSGLSLFRTPDGDGYGIRLNAMAKSHGAP